MAELEKKGPILPDVIHEMPISDGNSVQLFGAFDHLYYFPPLDVHWLRYYDDESRSISMIVLTEEGAKQILATTDVPYSVRETIFKREHDVLVQALGNWATADMFDIDIDVSAIEEELNRGQYPGEEPTPND